MEIGLKHTEILKRALEAITTYLSESPDPSEEAVEGLCDARALLAKALKGQVDDTNVVDLLTHDEWDELQDQCEEMVSHNFRFAVLAKLREKQAEQPAPSQYGSTELQATIVARAMEKNAAEQPAQQEPVAQPASEEDMRVYQAIAANYHVRVQDSDGILNARMLGDVKTAGQVPKGI